MARETQCAPKSAIVYHKPEYVDVPTSVPATGLAGFLGRKVNKTERRQEQREITVVGEHWLLEHRHHHIEKNNKGKDYQNQETTHEQHYFVLLTDGSLKHVYLWEEELVLTSYGRTSVRVDRGHEVWGIDSWAFIRAFDFEKRYAEYGTHGSGTKTWGDREPGKRLLVHAKGVGVSKALKKLLPADAGASSPSGRRPTAHGVARGAPSAKPNTPQAQKGVLDDAVQRLSNWPKPR